MGHRGYRPRGPEITPDEAERVLHSLNPVQQEHICALERQLRQAAGWGITRDEALVAILQLAAFLVAHGISVCPDPD